MVAFNITSGTILVLRAVLADVIVLAVFGRIAVHVDTGVDKSVVGRNAGGLIVSHGNNGRDGVAEIPKSGQCR